MRVFLKASFGNDSVAMIQTVYDWGFRDDVTVIYSDTGWAAKWWLPRVEKAISWVRSLGYDCVTIKSEGFEALARRKKSFPRQGIQFCTEKLKIEPSLEWLDLVDPNKEGIVLVGKRRAESKNRAQTPEFVHPSDLDGGRILWHPIVNMLEDERDAICARAGFPALPHRSKECFPCINSNRADLLVLAEDEDRVAEIEALENDMGVTSKGKPRTFFRPYRYMGATGIRQIVQWAKSDPGKFTLDDGTGDDCFSGQCGL